MHPAKLIIKNKLTQQIASLLIYTNRSHGIKS